MEPEDTNSISPEAIDKLLKFLPYFKKHEAEDLFTFFPPEKQEDGSVRVGHYTYHPRLLRFFDLVNKDWIISDYVGKISWEHLENKKWITNADIHDLKLAFTFLARAEYWSNGAWVTALEESIFTDLLERLERLSE